MNIREELKNLISKGPFNYRQITLVDDIGKVFLMGIRFDGQKIEIDSVFITPVGMGGFVELTDALKETGVYHLVMLKIVNARLAEHLSRNGWELKAGPGNWINFHLHL